MSRVVVASLQVPRSALSDRRVDSTHAKTTSVGVPGVAVKRLSEDGSMREHAASKVPAETATSSARVRWLRERQRSTRTVRPSCSRLHFDAISTIDHLNAICRDSDQPSNKVDVARPALQRRNPVADVAWAMVVCQRQEVGILAQLRHAAELHGSIDSLRVGLVQIVGNTKFDRSFDGIDAESEKPSVMQLETLKVHFAFEGVAPGTSMSHWLEKYREYEVEVFYLTDSGFRDRGTITDFGDSWLELTRSGAQAETFLIPVSSIRMARVIKPPGDSSKLLRPVETPSRQIEGDRRK